MGVDFSIGENMSEVLDGLLLGDGGVYAAKETHNAYYRQTCKYKEYLEEVQHLLIMEGVTFGDSPFYFRGNGYNTWKLTSKSIPYLTEQRKRWYIDGVKRLPNDIQLTPTSMLHWYIGDGSLFPKRGCLNTIEFAAHSFSFEEREVLKSQIQDIGLSSGNWKNGIIVIHKRSIFDFIDYIGECPSPCYQYKWDADKYDYRYPYTYAERKTKRLEKLKRKALNES